jgi:hypothetical protein
MRSTADRRWRSRDSFVQRTQGRARAPGPPLALPPAGRVPEVADLQDGPAGRGAGDFFWRLSSD